MGKLNKPIKTDIVGKGKVTPFQVAFIVDRYLSDNNYSQTRSTFRSEASNLLSKSPVQEAPRSLLTLKAILDDYISLKEQKVLVNQERVHLEQEKVRVQNLLKGMQNAMNAFNNSADVSPLPVIVPPTGAVVPRVDLTAGSKAGCPVFNTSVTMSTSRAWATHTDSAQFSTPVPNQAISKRKGSSEVPAASLISKRSRKSSNTKHLPLKGGLHECTHKDSLIKQLPKQGSTLSGSSLQGSTVVKCLFNQATKSPAKNSSGPKTPPPASSSQTDKSASPLEVCSTANSSKDNTSHQITSTNSTIISSQMIRISPVKQIAYCSIERNHSISVSSPAKSSSIGTSKRDHIKGRLNFDASDMSTSSEKPISDVVSTSESDRDDIFGLDLPSLDDLGVDFNLSDLLLDFDLQNDGNDCSGQAAGDFSPDSLSGSPQTSGDANIGANEFMKERSKVAEVFSETNMPGPDNTVTTIKSITKCIKILSPAKRQMT